jgi:hypothetical protein
MMKNKRTSLFISLPFIFLMGLALLSNFQVLFSVWQQWRPGEINQDASTLWEKRIEKLRDDLPETGDIGYLSEIDIPGTAYDAVDTNEEYVLTQYYLAPRKIIRGSQYPLVIGNFANLEIQDASMLEEMVGLKVVASYGYGIYLLKGTAP